ncbi:MAG TPA: hypothetical protein VNO55_10990 [Polyangia bacterium]|nr:hypothetical protein [Polyangia bacterium]
MSKTAFALVACSVLVSVVTTGCDQFMQKPRCKPLGDCGGANPVGTWVLDPSHVSCSEDIYIAPSDQRVVTGTVPVARQPPPEPALSDWCDQLVTNGGTMVTTHDPEFYHDDPRIGIASVHYGADGAFSAGLTQVGHYKLDFPTYCVRAFAAMDNRQADPANDPNGPAVSLCKQIEVAVKNAGNGAGAYPNATCRGRTESGQTDDPTIEAGGCRCEFDVTATAGPGGIYKLLNNNTMINFLNNGFPQTVTYCNRGDHLELTGANGSYLFGKTGLRTMSLVPDKGMMMQSPPMTTQQ